MQFKNIFFLHFYHRKIPRITKNKKRKIKIQNDEWRFFMNRTVSAVVSGAAAAAAIGTAVYMMNNRSGHANVRKMRRSAAKTVKAVGNIANGISSIMR